MIKPNTKGMIKLLGKPKPLIGTRDYDRDGTMNMLDCKPYNPRQQGWIHDKWKQLKEGVAKRRAERAELKRAERESYVEAKKTQAVRVGKARAKIEAERKIKTYKSGGVMGQFISGFKPPKGYRVAPAKTTIKPTYKYIKKGKHYIRKRIGKKTTTPQPATFNFPDINKPIFKW